ncbi:alanine--glyoxylate aminotransferase 2, mitochondrial-like [Babylonia areolata]|uniref:alanine--glyoxylate aminotransferase 2, mitochondrial-like n=1 Tax=Babylonia areolata TaxID=304850 RepID=UPI003FCF056D
MDGSGSLRVFNSALTVLRSARASSGINKVSCRPKSTAAPQVFPERSLPDMPPCDFQPPAYTGRSREELLRLRRTHLVPGALTYYREPVCLHQGHRQYLWDSSGKRYLDMFAGVVTVGVGHSHPKLIAAAEKQMRKLWHTSNVYLNEPIYEYAEKLTATLPDNLKVVYLTNSGSEANDLALLMARLYTGVFDAVSLRNGYHGASPSLMGVTAMSIFRYNTPTGFGMQQAMNPDVYRGPWGGARCRDSPAQTLRSCDCPEGCCKAGDLYIDQLEDVLKHSMPKDRCAAFIAEVVQGAGGSTQLPKGYLKKAYELVRARGGLCIADEVQTGFGRLGSHFWGFETHGVVPDIVTMAKAMGNGFPMAGVVTTPEVASVLGGALHINTFGGNPLAATVGSTVLDVIKEEGTQANSGEVGTYLLQELLKLREDFDVVGDVRGKGLMIGMELVTDKETKKPLPAEDMVAIWEDTKDMGVLLGKGGLNGNVFRIQPPMIITRDDVDYAVAVIRTAIDNHLHKN